MLKLILNKQYHTLTKLSGVLGLHEGFEIISVHFRILNIILTFIA